LSCRRQVKADGRGLGDPGAGGEAAKKQGEPIASQIAAVIPSRAIRRVAVIDDEGREVTATIIGDWPLVR
jgi:hypothetical protein